MQVGPVGAFSLPPAVDAAALTRQIVGAATNNTEVALDLTRVAAGAGPSAGSGGGNPTAEDIAAVQAALGLVESSAGRSGASSVRD